MHYRDDFPAAGGGHCAPGTLVARGLRIGAAPTGCAAIPTGGSVEAGVGVGVGVGRATTAAGVRAGGTGVGIGTGLAVTVGGACG